LGQHARTGKTKLFKLTKSGRCIKLNLTEKIRKQIKAARRYETKRRKTTKKTTDLKKTIRRVPKQEAVRQVNENEIGERIITEIQN
jgi:hypothetical protein